VSVVNPDLSFGEWTVTGGILIDNMFLDRPPGLTVGQTFTSITGVVHYTYGNYKIEPRALTDIVN
jgi:hypothetical protein